METTDRYTEWLSGLKHCVYAKKAMTQVALSKAAGIAKEHLNAILKERGKRAGENLQDSLSKPFGMTYDQMRHFGRWILDGNDPEQWRPGKPVTPPPHPPTLPNIPPTLPGFHITNKAALELAEWIEEASELIDYGEAVKALVAAEYPAFLEFLKKRERGGGDGTVQAFEERKVANGS